MNTLSITARGLALAISTLFVADASDAQTTTWVRPTPAEFKGTNYFPSTTLSINNSLGLLTSPGFGTEAAYVSARTSEEIAEIAKANINNIRLFGDVYGYLISPSNYMQNLADLARICDERRISITYVMWNPVSNIFTPNYLAVDPAAPPYDQGLHQALDMIGPLYTMSSMAPAPLSAVLGLGEPWQFVLHDTPGNGLFQAPYHGVMSSWPNNMGQRCLEYIDAIGNFFANNPVGQRVFGSYDGFNEPDCCFQSFASALELMQQTFTRLQSFHLANPSSPKFEFTIGIAGWGDMLQRYIELENLGIKQTYLSYHCYATGTTFRQAAQLNGSIGRLLNMEVVCSEFHDKNRVGHSGSLSVKLDDLVAEGIGGNVWAYLATNIVHPDPTGRSNSYVRFDGLVIPTTIPVASYGSPTFYIASPGLGAVDALSVRFW